MLIKHLPRCCKTFGYSNVHKTFQIYVFLQNIFIRQFTQNTLIRTFTIAAKHFKLLANWYVFTKHIHSVLFTQNTLIRIFMNRGKNFKLICLRKRHCFESWQNISNYHLACSCADTTNWRGSSQFYNPPSTSSAIAIIIKKQMLGNIKSQNMENLPNYWQ